VIDGSQATQQAANPDPDREPQALALFTPFCLLDLFARPAFAVPVIASSKNETTMMLAAKRVPISMAGRSVRYPTKRRATACGRFPRNPDWAPGGTTVDPSTVDPSTQSDTTLLCEPSRESVACESVTCESVTWVRPILRALDRPCRRWSRHNRTSEFIDVMI
jgi:hypothetical protein